MTKWRPRWEASFLLGKVSQPPCITEAMIELESYTEGGRDRTRSHRRVQSAETAHFLPFDWSSVDGLCAEIFARPCPAWDVFSLGAGLLTKQSSAYQIIPRLPPPVQPIFTNVSLSKLLVCRFNSLMFKQESALDDSHVVYVWCRKTRYWITRLSLNQIKGVAVPVEFLVTISSEYTYIYLYLLLIGSTSSARTSADRKQTGHFIILLF